MSTRCLYAVVIPGMLVTILVLPVAWMIWTTTREILSAFGIHVEAA